VEDRIVAVLSVDLAYRLWSHLGIVVLDRAHTPKASIPLHLGLARPVEPPISGPEQIKTDEIPISCEIIPSFSPGLDGNLRPAPAGPVDANLLAGRLNHLCGVRGIRILMLDGPQAWKSRTNGLEHARVSDRQLNRATKAGLPGMVKPLTCRTFAEFCMDVYDALCRRGWQRLATQEQPDPEREPSQERILVESCPYAAWKSLGLKPVPPRRRARVSDLAEAWAALRSIVPIVSNRPPNHDQMQAIVAGLPGLAIEERNATATHIVGNPPRREEGHWREGFIVLPLAPVKPVGVRWLH
jgi:hypothetical protein